MNLCRSCRRLSPHGSRFCGQCGRSFGCRVCPKGHASPPYSNACTACGSTDLSVSVKYRTLRPPTLLLSAFLSLVVMKVVVANFGLLAGITLNICDWVMGFVTGATLADLAFSIVHFALLSVLPFFLVWVFFERCRLPSKSLGVYGKLVKATARTAIGCAVLVGRFPFSPRKDKEKRRDEKARGKTELRESNDDGEGYQ